MIDGMLAALLLAGVVIYLCPSAKKKEPYFPAFDEKAEMDNIKAEIKMCDNARKRQATVARLKEMKTPNPSIRLRPHAYQYRNRKK